MGVTNYKICTFTIVMIVYSHEYKILDVLGS